MRPQFGMILVFLQVFSQIPSNSLQACTSGLSSAK